MRKVDAILMLDCQDDFFPPEVGGDDIIKAFADALFAQRLAANFLFFASRALILKRRDRTDVIRSLECHEIGLHTPGPDHPCLPEYAATGDWFSAVAEAERRESEAVNVIRDVFGRDPCTLSQHGNYAAPHIFPVAAKMRLPYVYGFPAAPPKYSISWYCGALCFPWRPVWTYERKEPTFELGDESWVDDAFLEKRLGQLEAFLNWCEVAEQPFVNIFLAHPYRLLCVELPEYWRNPNGRNLAPHVWGKNGSPRLRSAGQVETGRRNIARVAAHLSKHPKLNVLSISQAVAKYGFQPTELTADNLKAAAEGLATHREEYAPVVSPAQVPLPLDIPLGAPFSPAELAVGLAQSVFSHLRGEGVPRTVRRRDVLGPVSNPIIIPEQRWMSPAQFAACLGSFLDEVEKTGHLPANVGPLDARVGLGSLYRVLATTYLQAIGGETIGNISAPRYPRYPREGRDLGRQFADVIEFDLVDPELNGWNLEKHGRLQSWTLKPAWNLA